MIAKYIIKEFIKIFLYFFLAFILIFWIADFFGNISTFIESKNLNLLNIFRYFIFQTPLALYYIIPFSVLSTGCFLFSNLNTKYEIIAFRTLGVKRSLLYKILFTLGIIFYLILFINNEFINPDFFYKAKMIKNVELKDKKNYAVLQENKIWYKKDQYIFKIGIANFDAGFMQSITVLKFDDNFRISERIDAKGALYVDNKWKLQNSENYKFNNNRLISYSESALSDIPLDFNREDFVVITIENKNISFMQLLKILKNLKNSSIDTVKYKTDLLNKFTYPLVNILFIFIAFLLNIKNPRDRGRVTAALISAVVGFFFFIVHNFFINLAYMKFLPFFIAPFISFILLTILCCFLDRKVRY